MARQVSALIAVLLQVSSASAQAVDSALLELSIGTGRTDQDLIVRAGAVRTDSQGRIYVLDVGDDAVRVWSRGGEVVHTIGRRGEGPGEFTLPTSFGLIGDTLWVIDARRSSVAFFNLDGSLIQDRRVLVDLDDERYSPRPPSTIVSGTEWIAGMPPSVAAAKEGARLILVKGSFPEEGEQQQLDTLAETRPPVSNQISSGTRVVHPARELRDHPLVIPDVSRREVIIIERSAARPDMTARILKQSWDGSTLAAASLEVEGRETAGPRLDSLLLGIMELPGFPAMSKGALASSLGIAPYYPAIEAAVVDGQGGLWVSRGQYSSPRNQDMVEWWRYDDGLQLVDAALLPKGESLVWAEGSSLFTVALGPFDVQLVKRYRIE